jgi:catechol 2,3-dioxygenase-like lactoylglutathione lyase family enzyme
VTDVDPEPGPGQGLPPGQVLGIDHVVVVVADLAASVERYAEAFGAPSAVVGGAEIGYRRAMFELGDSGQRIELCQPLAADEPGGDSQASRAFRRRLETVGEGVHNVAVLVRDMRAARSALEHLRARVIPSGHSETFFLHPEDMSGALIQFMPPETPEAAKDVDATRGREFSAVELPGARET